MLNTTKLIIYYYVDWLFIQMINLVFLENLLFIMLIEFKNLLQEIQKLIYLI